MCSPVSTNKPVTICMNHFFNLHQTLRKLKLRSRQPILRFGTAYRNLLSPDFPTPIISQSLLMVAALKRDVMYLKANNHAHSRLFMDVGRNSVLGSRVKHQPVAATATLVPPSHPTGWLPFSLTSAIDIIIFGVLFINIIFKNEKGSC